ncbi:MAG: hypothetical protein AAFR14_01535 [Bacteroidota bacterium]
MKRIATLVLFLVLVGQLASQTQRLVITADEDPYRDVKGSQYFYAEPTMATLTMYLGQKPHRVSLNVDLYERYVEVYKGERTLYIPFDQIVTIEPDQGTSLIYSAGKMIALPYIGERYKLSNELRVVLDEKVHYPPGQIIRVRKFVRKNKYQLTDGDRTKKVRLSPRQVKRFLGPEALDIAQDHSLDLKRESGVATLLDLMELTAVDASMR